MKIRVCIPDFGMGNLHSLERSLYRMDVNSLVSADPRDIEKADKIILPGVGHFQKAMENLSKLHMTDALNEFVLGKKKPILGICLGMQLMAKSSEEGNVAGFGWLNGTVTKFKVRDSVNYKIPHIGWNRAIICKNSLLLKNISDRSEFYFLHAYHFNTNNNADVLTETIYENRFASAIAKENIFGVQFHPEKSHAAGATLLQNFISF